MYDRHEFMRYIETNVNRQKKKKKENSVCSEMRVGGGWKNKWGLRMNE